MPSLVPGQASMHFSEVHEFVYSAAADTLAFRLTCFLHLPIGRLHTATVRWFQAPTADPVGVRVGLVPSSGSGVNAAEPSDRNVSQALRACQSVQRAMQHSSLKLLALPSNEPACWALHASSFALTSVAEDCFVVQVGSSAQVAQEAFKYVGLQAAVESFFLSEAEASVQHFNALVALLVAERGLGLPDSLARPGPMQPLCLPCMGESCETLFHSL